MTHSVEERRQMIEPDHPELSIRRQCELVGLNRSSYYYEPAQETEFNLMLMRQIDELYLKHPFMGSRRMTRILRRQLEVSLNRKRVQRLMRKMGIEAVYPKPKTTQAIPSIRSTRICCATSSWCAPGRS